MIRGFLNLPWPVWALLALAVAIFYSFVWPQKAAMAATGFRFFVLRWGHAVTWILLALSFILRGISTSWNGAANLFGLAGGLMYVLFLVMAFVLK